MLQDCCYLDCMTRLFQYGHGICIPVSDQVEILGSAKGCCDGYTAEGEDRKQKACLFWVCFKTDRDIRWRYAETEPLVPRKSNLVPKSLQAGKREKKEFPIWTAGLGRNLDMSSHSKLKKLVWKTLKNVSFAGMQSKGTKERYLKESGQARKEKNGDVKRQIKIKCRPEQQAQNVIEKPKRI